MTLSTTGLNARSNNIVSDRAKNADVLQARFGMKAASYLSEAADQLPHSVSERLRAARMQALAQRRVELARPQPAFGWLAWLGAALQRPLAPAGNEGTSGSASTLDAFDTEEQLSWWGRIATALPLVVLVVGLFMISTVQQDNRIQEIAEVDAALLTDALPPSAFADTGFLQFLKTVR